MMKHQEGELHSPDVSNGSLGPLLQRGFNIVLRLTVSKTCHIEHFE